VEEGLCLFIDELKYFWSGRTFKVTTDFGTIQEGASKLIIQPIQIASLNYGKGHTKIELEPIVIDLKK